MKQVKETLGHILVMQLLVSAMLIDRWTSDDQAL
jgi:hypothetical protein